MRPLVSLLVLTLLAISLWFLQDPIRRGLSTLLAQNQQEEPLQPDPEKYRALIQQLESDRQLLAERLAAASSPAEQGEIENEARLALESTLPELMRCWLGTPWDFNGTSDTPGKGKIACGYFVSTVLRDAGFRVQRFKLAQQASQNIITTFIPRSQIHIRVGTDYDSFLAELISRGPGVHIVGLDSHVAFLIVNDDGQINFIHSSGSRPWTVVDEERSAAQVLRASNYRVTGNLTSNPEVLRKWLKGAEWETRT